ncbi:DUF5304 family protein [Streptomyces sp. DSM 42041]|uniref:DUF5304 family protein n=1 Tax=Streptomyces hazeniae TaxID=3075538 RepID=A0ABU2NXW3_9ACTN|nr:DUF5304 family protein [Streptomyces sp. DSM 42041]MDT0381023.1 DUF5304 family protein [Streptomyces sp. DSM 42041]
MSDAFERNDADAWAEACEEDLAAERERRRAAYGPQPVSASEELRRLADAVSAKVTEIGKPFAGTPGGFAAQGFAQQFLAQARAVVEPVVERNPQIFDHLAAAGNEIAAAYRAAVQGQEQRWSADLRPQDAAPAPRGDELRPEGVDRPDGPDRPGDVDRPEGPDGAKGTRPTDRRDDDGPDGPERIDLD